MVRKIAIAILLVAGAVAAAQTKPNDAADPAQVLARAREVMGFGKTGGSVVHMHWITAVLQPYQSDRMYPPFFSMMLNGESWFDPESGVERTSAQMMYPGSPLGKPSAALGDAATRFMFRPTGDPVAVPPDDARNLNAWLVVADWSKAKGVRYVGRETFRDYPRIVLARKTDDGEQRLLLDPKSGFPVKLEYEASHYLWGQQKIQYIFSNWQQAGAIFTANSAFRMADDEVETSRTAGDVELIARDAAPSMALPAAPAQAVNKTPMFLRPLPPKTVDVSANVKVLSNPGYGEGVVAVGDEVFVLDATQGEERARQDQEIIRKLYPSAKKINVVVTDLAWPHVAGLRYWVANGATVISHPAARPFLQQVLDRRWTMKPDSYERARKTAKLKFVAVDKAQDFAGGKIRIFPIDGIGSEVALVAYVPDERFLWASDYIQTLDEPSMYAAEVMAAVQRENVQPQRVAAEHLNLTEWANVLAAQDVKAKSAAGSQ